MLESCVAPILILIISMFYKKNEQVGAPYRIRHDDMLLITFIDSQNLMVLLHGYSAYYPGSATV